MKRLKTAMHGELEAFSHQAGNFIARSHSEFIRQQEEKYAARAKNTTDGGIVSLGNLGARRRGFLRTHAATSTSTTTTTNLVIMEFPAQDSPDAAELDTPTTPVTGEHRRIAMPRLQRPRR